MVTLKIWKKRTHTQLSLQTASTFSGHILRGNPSAYLPFCPLSLLPSALPACKRCEKLSSRHFLFYFIFRLFFSCFWSRLPFLLPFFTRTPLGVSSSGSLACCLSCHLAPAKLVYSLPAFSTSHPSSPPPCLCCVTHFFLVIFISSR